MADAVKMAFDPAGQMVQLDDILPLRVVRPEARKGRQFLRLKASIREVGLIEPLVIYPQAGGAAGHRRYTLLDGHFRLDVLRELGHADALCLIADDDEAFTYNHKVNRIAPIQEHFMVMKAIDSGVPEDRIASTLNIDLKAVRMKRDLLTGICEEAVTLLRDKQVPAKTFREVRRVTAMRQIEMAELMVAGNNFTADYALCLVTASQEKDLVEPDKQKIVPGMRADDIARMEREMELLQRDFVALEETHGKNTLNLVLAITYLRKLLDCGQVVKYLSRRHPGFLGEFQKLAELSDPKGTLAQA